jgi:glutamate-1-semialdehyde 2,1-aminomutase
VLPYNDIAALDACFAERGATIAAVLVEPIAANMGVVPPAPRFLEAIRAYCSQYGAVCVFDEVITGFRVARGGAQERFGINADLTIMGKVIGGGLPLAAVGGTRSLMEQLAPLGPVYQAGTLSGNPLATAAGLATLELLDAAAYARLDETATALADGLRAAFDKIGVPAEITQGATLVGVRFTNEAVTDYAGAQRADHALYSRWFHHLLRKGVFVAPSSYEAMFPGLAHDPSHISAIVDATVAPE